MSNLDFFNSTYLHEKNFVEVSKNIDLKIIFLDKEDNYVGQINY